MHDEAHFGEAVCGGQDGEGVARTKIGGGGVVGGGAGGFQPLLGEAVALEGVGNAGALFGGGAGKVVLFEDFVQADARFRAAREVEKVEHSAFVRRGGGGRRGGRFGLIEGGLEFVACGAVMGQAAGEAGEAGKTDEFEAARRVFGGAVGVRAAAAAVGGGADGRAFVPEDAAVGGGAFYPAQPVAAQHGALAVFFFFVGRLNGGAAAVGRTFEQVGKGVARRAAAAGGVDGELLFGAGEGDVEQAQALAQIFVGQLVLVGFVELAQFEKFAAVCAVEDVPVAGGGFARVPREGAENERILQTL
ncbi:hypothetical protein HMPREF9120_02090 [Neisseria sp. oral taxon 020 str. F0370]|nr:hypothetical protein HMPREF9120_02090 [Neisseria sp. oral taxon 020 str. F0370]